MTQKINGLAYLVLLLGVTIFGSTIPGFAEDNATGTELRVLCYNIHHGEGIDGQLNIERIAAVINMQKPDIVMLQEVDNKAQRTKQVDQAAKLEQLTGLKTVFGKTIDLQGGAYGLALMSRFPIAEHEMTLLPQENAQAEQRGVLHATIEIADGKKIVIACTHLSASGNDADRLAQAEKIVKTFTDVQLPIILAGDFNAPPSSQTIALIKKHWETACDENEPTCENPNPRSKIDFIFYRPDAAFSVKESSVVEEKTASDHRPVLSILTLRQ